MQFVYKYNQTLQGFGVEIHKIHKIGCNFLNKLRNIFIISFRGEKVNKQRKDFFYAFLFREMERK